MDASAAAAAEFKAIKAYSYLRFSTPEQARGDSFRRQKELAERYALEHGLRLDEALTYRDLGVSAFKGANAEGGKLGAFLQAVKDGEVPKGSFLLVEGLDRLSRQKPRKAVRVLEDLCEAGIHVVTLSDRKVYSESALDDDGGATLMWALMVMIRANEESETKSRRVKAAWQAKYANALKGEASTRSGERIITKKAPLWLKREGGQWVVLEERADVVRRIYALAASGVGCNKIAIMLNEEGVKPFGYGTGKRGGLFWHRSSIQHVLRNKGAGGIFEPYATSTRKRDASVGLPAAVEGYYPPIIDRDVFDTVQALNLAHRMPQDRVRVPRGAALGKDAVCYTLAGLARCACCGASATRIWKGQRARSRIVCTTAKMGATYKVPDSDPEVEAKCRYNSVEVATVEAALRRDVERIVHEAPVGNEALRGAVQSAQDGLDGLQDEIEELVRSLARGFSPSLREALAAREAEAEQLRARLRKLSADLAASTPASVAGRLAAFRAGIKAGDPSAANLALRQLVEKVVVDFQEGILALHWRAADVTTDVQFRVAPLDDATLAEAEGLA